MRLVHDRSSMWRRKALGQHFLRDRAAASRIAAAVAAQPGDAVVEIGPGRGALTEPLLAAAGRIAAIEVDAALAAALRERYDPTRLVLIEDDVLRVPLAEVLRALGAEPTARLRVAGNLPYSISKPVAAKLIRERGAIERAVLMFQREVAERIAAPAGSRHYGPLSVLARLAYEVRTLFDLGPSAFRPPPQVDSRVVLWQRRADERLSPALEPRLRACLAASFGRRRRTLRNNLRAALGDARVADTLLEAAAVDGALRAEQVGEDGFLRLAEAWPQSL